MYVLFDFALRATAKVCRNFVCILICIYRIDIEYE
jgi:hypothetical protein